MAESGTTIENTNATEVDSSFEICQKSGFKVKRGKLVQDGYGAWVHPDFAEGRHPQELVRTKAEKQTGSIRPENVNNPTFIDSDNPISADDL